MAGTLKRHAVPLLIVTWVLLFAGLIGLLTDIGVLNIAL